MALVEVFMEIKAYLNLLWRWSWLIGLAALLGAVLTFVISLQIPPTYQATATMTVARRSAADNEFMALTERPTATYIELLRKRPVLEGVIDRLQLNIEPQQLDKKLRITALRNTALIALTVSDTDPERAAAIANELVRLVSERGHSLLGNDVTIRRYSLHLIDPAIAVTKPASPNIPLNVVVMAVVSAMLALGAVLIRDHLDDRVRSPEEIKALVGMQTLATIPRQGRDQGRGKASITRDDFAPEMESLRMLRAHIDHIAANRSIRSLLVTSATAGEGKSTTAANLAVVLAQSGRRVILVDTDLRQPSLHTIFQQANTRGVTTALQSEDENVSTYLMPTGIANLSLLPSGPLPPNPADLAGSPQMARLIERLTGCGDIVLLDSPALLPVVDSIPLARACDATVLVVRAGNLRAGELVSAHDRLAQFGIEPLGVVLNGARESFSHGYHHRGREPEPAILAGRSQPLGTDSVYTPGQPQHAAAVSGDVGVQDR